MSRVPAKSVRASFTADEDTLLMRYIATYNPAKKYRSGNALYKRLEANVDNKWNWSKAHPWQSWQHRYRKNMEEFDRRILKYQGKKRIDPEQQSRTEFSSADEVAATDRLKETSQGKKRAGGPESCEQRKVKRAKWERDQPDAGSSRSPVMNTDRTRPKPVSPIFGSLSPTHHYSPPLRTKLLPKVIEGHFTTALTDRLGRVRLGGHSEEMTWPPDRGKKGKDPVLLLPYHIDPEPHPFNQPVAWPSKLTTAAGPSSLTSSTELPHGQPVVVPSATPMSKESARLLNAPPLAQISTESASSTMADEAASGEEDEESNHDIKEAEEESVVEKLVSGSPLEGLQDQDDHECDAENEPELAPDDAEQLDEDDRHHDFSLRERPPAIRIKRESLIPPSLYGPLGDSAQVLNGVLSDVCRTRSVSPSWNANEGITLLSGNGRMHQMLERQLGKHGMKKRVAQLLR